MTFSIIVLDLRWEDLRTSGALIASILSIALLQMSLEPLHLLGLFVCFILFIALIKIFMVLGDLQSSISGVRSDVHAVRSDVLAELDSKFNRKLNCYFLLTLLLHCFLRFNIFNRSECAHRWTLVSC